MRQETVLHECSITALVLPCLFVLILSAFPLQANSSQTVPEFPAVPVAAAPAAPDSAFYARYPYVIIIDEGEDADISDELFYRNAASVVFKVSKWDLPAEDKTLHELHDSVLPHISRDSLRIVRVKMRGAASPEGPEKFNRFLSQQRQKALYDFVAEQLQLPQGDSLLLETATEDYNYLYRRMMQDGDPDFGRVKHLFDEYMPRLEYDRLKRALRSIDGGRLWRRLLTTYFPSLRAARLVIVCQRRPEPKPEPIVVVEPVKPVEVREPAKPEPWVERYPRREMLSVKTNLLFYGVYMPSGYNRWCPIPNIAIEYYPLKGHFTYGASIDFPWWQDYHAYKFFQIRNYQLDTRYYLRSGSIDRRPEGKGAAFRGLYLQAYGNLGLFGICFDAKRGWVGEGIGGGIGIGYVLPLTRKGHWRLEFQLQAGIFHCKYDPYQYENTVNPDYHDDLYYYKWSDDPDLFKKRQYRFTWIGPTRVGVTLSYDLLYRKARKKTDPTIMPYGTEPTRRYNPLVPYEKELKGGAQ